MWLSRFASAFIFLQSGMKASMSRLTTKLSGPARQGKAMIDEKAAAAGRVRCSARLGDLPRGHDCR
jgi:hypothetical protein